MNQVSLNANDTAKVAETSLGAAEKGAHAVQNSIRGMNEIRDQIQETSKRIKRLGESSQEIGEIVELISDITEQTNVLALNAAIQAASAGEAGRGFTVVAEEVQRLAERSAEATKQIAAIVKSIQRDTQDAVEAMERSTRGVVEGTQTADEADRALREIEQISTRLAGLITSISSATQQQVVSATQVAGSMKLILGVTQQTTEGTKKTARSAARADRTRGGAEEIGVRIPPGVMDSLADTTTLSWITVEVDQALERVRQIIAKFEAAPEDAAVLRSCPEHLHQVSGALNMVGLAEATQFCETLEGGFAALNGSPPSIAAVAVIDRGVLALKQFVDGLARGEPNAPARLYPAYRELASSARQGGLRGKRPVLSRSDAAGAGPSPAERARSSGLPAFLRAQRARFQRGLLAWLRQGPGGLEDMRAVLDAMHAVAAQLPERRALWWVAMRTDGCLAEAKDAEWLARAKALCNKLDFQIRDLAAGSRVGQRCAIARNALCHRLLQRRDAAGSGRSGRSSGSTSSYRRRKLRRRT